MSEAELMNMVRRVLSRLDDIERRLKEVEANVQRVRREIQQG
jgi:hypothetical protein